MIDYVDVVFDDDDEIGIEIGIVIVYVDDVLPMMIVIDHVVFDDVISHYYFPKNKNLILHTLFLISTNFISQIRKYILIPTIKRFSLKLTIFPFDHHYIIELIDEKYNHIELYFG